MRKEQAGKEFTSVSWALTGVYTRKWVLLLHFSGEETGRRDEVNGPRTRVSKTLNVRI